MTLSLKLKQNYKAYLLIGYAFLLTIHFIVKDRLFPLSILYYASPLPIIIGATLLLILLFFKKLIYRNVLIVILAILTAMWWYNCYFKHETPKQQETSKVLYWNLAKRNQLPVNDISENTNTFNPEIIAFVEVPKKTLKNLKVLEKALPDYHFKVLDGAMLVGCKSTVKSVSFAFKEDAYKANLIEVESNSKTTKFILVDLTANLLVSKNRPLTFISEFAKKEATDFIVGDFNTPYESIYFEQFKNNFTSFHRYNDGFAATWPFGIPLLEIDHFWLSNSHQPIALHKFYSDASDHAMLISEFKLNYH